MRLCVCSIETCIKNDVKNKTSFWDVRIVFGEGDNYQLLLLDLNNLILYDSMFPDVKYLFKGTHFNFILYNALYLPI